MAVRVRKAVRSVSGGKGGFWEFLRAQFSAQLATVLDFTITFLLYYLFAVSGGAATFVGAFCGGVLNCVVNYEWTFRASGLSKRRVVLKYAFVWAGSIFLNTWGTCLLAARLEDSPALWHVLGPFAVSHFAIAKVVTAILVGLFWNYYMQRCFVYRSVRWRIWQGKNGI